MFALYITIDKIFTVEMCMPSIFEMGYGLYANQKHFLFDSNSNVCPACRHLRDIRSWNMHDLDCDLYNGPRSNVIMPIESKFSTY